MVRNLKRNDENFSEKDFLTSKNKQEHLEKEITVNLQEQHLVEKRIQTIQDYLDTLPSNDSQYGIIHSQIRMDQIELDELKKVEESLKQQLEKNL